MTLDPYDCTYRLFLELPDEVYSCQIRLKHKDGMISIRIATMLQKINGEYVLTMDLLNPGNGLKPVISVQQFKEAILMFKWSLMNDPDVSETTANTICTAFDHVKLHETWDNLKPRI